jgi:hypothetical protein
VQSNATAAIKLVGECFPWKHGGELRYLTHNHTSVLGLRELARARGITVTCVDPPLTGIQCTSAGTESEFDFPWTILGAAPRVETVIPAAGINPCVRMCACR